MGESSMLRFQYAVGDLEDGAGTSGYPGGVGRLVGRIRLPAVAVTFGLRPLPRRMPHQGGISDERDQREAEPLQGIRLMTTLTELRRGTGQRRPGALGLLAPQLDVEGGQLLADAFADLRGHDVRDLVGAADAAGFGTADDAVDADVAVGWWGHGGVAVERDPAAIDEHRCSPGPLQYGEDLRAWSAVPRPGGGQQLIVRPVPAVDRDPPVLQSRSVPSDRPKQFLECDRLCLQSFRDERIVVTALIEAVKLPESEVDEGDHGNHEQHVARDPAGHQQEPVHVISHPALFETIGRMMKVYAERPLRVLRQVVGDLLLVLWVGGWIWLGQEVHDRLDALRRPSVQVGEASRNLANSLADTSDQVRGLQLVGDVLAAPFDVIVSSTRQLADASNNTQQAIGNLADIMIVATALFPILFALTLWAFLRLRWMSHATAAARVRATGEGDGLLAAQALASGRLDQIGKYATSGNPLDDPLSRRRLAGFQLRRLGLRGYEAV